MSFVNPRILTNDDTLQPQRAVEVNRRIDYNLRAGVTRAGLVMEGVECAFLKSLKEAGKWLERNAEDVVDDNEEIHRGLTVKQLFVGEFRVFLNAAKI